MNVVKRIWAENTVGEIVGNGISLLVVASVLLFLCAAVVSAFTEVPTSERCFKAGYQQAWPTQYCSRVENGNTVIRSVKDLKAEQ